MRRDQKNDMMSRSKSPRKKVGLTLEENVVQYKEGSEFMKTELAAAAYVSSFLSVILVVYPTLVLFAV